MPPDFKKINLQDKQVLPTIQHEARRIIENNWTDHASKLWHALRDALPTVTDQDLARTYQIIMQDLGWILLPILTEAQRFALFRGSLLRAIQIGIELESALTRLVYTIPPMIWLEVAPQYLQALRGNTEPLGPKTLGAWFTDFQRTMPDQKPTDLDVLRYLGQDPAAKELTEAERALLIKAFQYYVGLTPLSLAEVDKYVTPEERAAFEGELEQLPDASVIVGGSLTPIVGGSTSNNGAGAGDAEAEVEQPATAPIPALPRTGESPSVSRPSFAPLPQSPYMAESDSPLDRTPIARPRHEYRAEVGSRDKNEGFGAVRRSVSDGGRNQESRNQNERVVNLRQPPRAAGSEPPMPRRQPAAPLPSPQPKAAYPPQFVTPPDLPKTIEPTPKPQPAVLPSSPPIQTTRRPVPPIIGGSLTRSLRSGFARQNQEADFGVTSNNWAGAPRPAPLSQSVPIPRTSIPSPSSYPTAPTPQNTPRTTGQAAPPSNLPVARSTHNEGQEMTPYKPEQDPFMPHKAKPLPRLSGNVVDLKRE